jgi:hypothetical protein
VSCAAVTLGAGCPDPQHGQLALHEGVPLCCSLDGFKSQGEGGVAPGGQPAGWPVDGHTVLQDSTQSSRYIQTIKDKGWLCVQGQRPEAVCLGGGQQ